MTIRRSFGSFFLLFLAFVCKFRDVRISSQILQTQVWKLRKSACNSVQVNFGILLPSILVFRDPLRFFKYQYLIIQETRCLTNGRQRSSKARSAYRIPYSADLSTSNWRYFAAVYLLARHTKSGHSQKKSTPLVQNHGPSSAIP